MSTRATYRVREVSEYSCLEQCFYIHYDGYPEGAVWYFNEFTNNLQSLAKKDARWRPGKAISAFGILPFSEFTKSHESHGDTEYRYDLCYNQDEDKIYLCAFKLSSQGRFWVRFFDGELSEFISKYSKAEVVS
jgi:hypothetical protein